MMTDLALRDADRIPRDDGDAFTEAEVVDAVSAIAAEVMAIIDPHYGKFGGVVPEKMAAAVVKRLRALREHPVRVLEGEELAGVMERAKATVPEDIVVTEEMVEAGALVLLRRFHLDADEAEVTADIYRAMEAKR